jgi:iron-sulfur cluster assembly protein CyaY
MGMLAGSSTMTESEFESLADAALAALESAFAASLPDADVQSKGAGVIQIEFDDGSIMVINRHGAAREIWVAAQSGGFHFRHDGRLWRDTRDGSELFAAVSKLASQQSGTRVELRQG